MSAACYAGDLPLRRPCGPPCALRWKMPSAFSQLRALRVRIPLTGVLTRNGTFVGAARVSMVGDEGCHRLASRAGGAADAFGIFATHAGKDAHALCSFLRFVGSSLPWLKRSNRSVAGVGDEGFRGCFASAPAAGGCAALACCAANGFAVHSLRTPNGVRIPLTGALTRNGTIAGAVFLSMVGDEGFEPPALCV